VVDSELSLPGFFNGGRAPADDAAGVKKRERVLPKADSYNDRVIY
jgi:hypothetical protein